MDKLNLQIKKSFPNLIFEIKNNITKDDIEQWEYYVWYEWIDWQRCWFYSWDKLSKLNKEHIIKWTI